HVYTTVTLIRIITFILRKCERGANPNPNLFGAIHEVVGFPVNSFDLCCANVNVLQQVGRTTLLGGMITATEMDFWRIFQGSLEFLRTLSFAISKGSGSRYSSLDLPLS
ncbi:hypothetical protein WDU94_009876, partial [Cyamophila willieti]